METEIACFEDANDNQAIANDGNNEVIIGSNDVILHQQSYNKSIKLLLFGPGAPKWGFAEPTTVMVQRGLSSQQLRSEVDDINAISCREYNEAIILPITLRVFSIITLILNIYLAVFTSHQTIRVLSIVCAVVIVLVNFIASKWVCPLNDLVIRAHDAIRYHMDTVLRPRYRSKKIRWEIHDRSGARNQVTTHIIIRCLNDHRIEDKDQEEKSNSPTIEYKDDENGDGHKVVAFDIDGSCTKKKHFVQYEQQIRDCRSDLKDALLIESAPGVIAVMCHNTENAVINTDHQRKIYLLRNHE